MKRVILIEDDRSLRATLSMALSRRGCCVKEVPDLVAVRRCADEEEPPDGILLDLRLGDDDGMEAITFLRKWAPNARLVVLTGYGSIPSAMKAVRLGADDYLLKPAGIGQIWNALFSDVVREPDEDGTIRSSLARVEWEHIQRVIHDHNGNISHAATALGIDRRTLQRKLNKLPPDS